MNTTLTAKDAAKYCGLGLDAFRDARKRGEGPAVFDAHGGRPRFALSSLDTWMASRSGVDPLSRRKGRAA